MFITKVLVPRGNREALKVYVNSAGEPIQPTSQGTVNPNVVDFKEDPELVVGPAVYYLVGLQHSFCTEL